MRVQGKRSRRPKHSGVLYGAGPNQPQPTTRCLLCCKTLLGWGPWAPCGWASPLEEALSEAGNPALTPKALAMLRVIRAYERRVRQLALKADYRLARILPR